MALNDKIEVTGDTAVSASSLERQLERTQRMLEEAIRERSAAQTDALVRIEAARDKLQSKHDDEVSALRSQIEAERQGRKEELDSLRTKHKAEVSAERQGHKEELDSLRTKHEAEVSAERQGHKEELDSLRTKHEAEVSALRSQIEAEKAKQEQDREASGNALQKTMDRLRSTHKREMTQMANKNQEAVINLKKENAKKLEQLEDRKDHAADSHEVTIRMMASRYTNTIDGIVNIGKKAFSSIAGVEGGVGRAKFLHGSIHDPKGFAAAVTSNAEDFRPAKMRVEYVTAATLDEIKELIKTKKAMLVPGSAIIPIGLPSDFIDIVQRVEEVGSKTLAENQAIQPPHKRSRANDIQLQSGWRTYFEKTNCYWTSCDNRMTFEEFTAVIASAFCMYEEALTTALDNLELDSKSAKEHIVSIQEATKGAVFDEKIALADTRENTPESSPVRLEQRRRRHAATGR